MNRYICLGLVVICALSATGCADLARASRPSDPYSGPDKPHNLPKCPTPSSSMKSEGPNSPTPMQQETAGNCR